MSFRNINRRDGVQTDVRIKPLIVAVAMCTILSGRGFACFCFSIPLCSQITTLSESGAIFVGRVIEVWPTSDVVARDYRHLSLDQMRRMLIRRWGDVLSAEEQRDIRTLPDRETIAFRFVFLQRVRFAIDELFAGPAIREVYTDTTSCGFRFEPDRRYLVNSVRDGVRYRTGACFRTNRVESNDAVEDLKALRAWKSGNPLAPRIYGRIPSDQLRPNLRVYLRDGPDEKSVRVSADGRFSFDGLEHKRYRLEIRDERGNGERVIDLSRLGCFEATPWFSGAWEIGGSPVQMPVNSSNPTPGVPPRTR